MSATPLPLAERIARDRALVEARVADLPRLKQAEREARKRKAAVAAAAAVKMAEFKAARLAAAETDRLKRKGEKREQRRLKKAARRRGGVKRRVAAAGRPPSRAREGGKHRHLYVERAAMLASIGYRTYAEYLRSRLWASIRGRTMKRDARACRLCGAQAEQVHHTSYSKATLLGQDGRHLYAVCEGCHEWVEFHGGVPDDAYRRTPDEMIAETERLLAARQEAVAAHEAAFRAGRELDREFALRVG